MPARADVVVIGLGAMGSCAAMALARRGQRVIGFDRYHPPHQFGSSHGRSRIIREAYYESPAYVPLVRRAWEQWRAMERDAGRPLLRQTGGLMLGTEASGLIRGALQSAKTHQISIEMLGSAEVRRRFPALAPPAGSVGVLEPNAGILDPEACVESALHLAAAAGAVCRFDTKVLGWRDCGRGLEVNTSSGSVTCGRVVCSVGSWVGELVPASLLPATVERQVFAWFEPTTGGELLLPGRLPVFLWEHQPNRIVYGFPDDGAGFKAAIHHEGDLVSDPADLDWVVRGADLDRLTGVLATLVPAGWGRVREARVCPYTDTPDRHFVIGEHPQDPRVLLVSPCSGHGFKFATAVGEMVADLAVGGRLPPELALFAPSRFGSPA